MALLALNSCTTVAIKDEEVCADEGSQGAYCVHTMKPDTRQVPKSLWDDLRFGYLCISPESYADWKAELESLCSISNDCSADVVQAVKNVSKASDAAKKP